jgi:HlyD family secretion protein
MIPATVIYLSADSLPNDRRVTDDNGFIARVKIDADGASMISHFRATPGMPAEIYIRTGQRTFFEYLIKPIHDTMSRSFRER